MIILRIYSFFFPRGRSTLVLPSLRIGTNFLLLILAMKVIKTTSHPFTRALELFFEKNISKKGENWECPIITSFLAELAEKKNDVIMAHDCKNAD